MAYAQIDMLENGVQQSYILNFSCDDIIVLVKDKFINWKELVLFILFILIPYPLIIYFIDSTYF